MAVTPTLDEPCGVWPLETSCLPVEWDPEALTEQQQAALEIATEILWRLTAGEYGTCEVTLRPCRRPCLDAGSSTVYPYSWMRPYVNGGEWYNTCGGRCGDVCSCKPLCELTLPGSVASIEEVLIDGVVVAPETYFVDNAAHLVRISPDCWPECQDLSKPTTEENTFSVTYTRGKPIPIAGRKAVTAYAVELWKACVNVKCRLPQRVRDITREGLSMTLIDPMDFLDKGKTGLLEVDSWLAAVNPYGRRSQSRVYSPDIPTPRRQTWP